MIKQNKAWFGQNVPSVELDCLFPTQPLVQGLEHTSAQWIVVKAVNKRGHISILLFACFL